MGEQNDRRYRRHSILVAIFAAYLLVVSMTAVYAARIIQYTYGTTVDIEDEFVPVAVSCSVKDNGNGTYTITNTSNTSVYLRFTVAPTWVSTDTGRTHWSAPTYSVSLSSNSWMTSSDGFYYYVNPLAEGSSVTVTVNHTNATSPPVHHEYRVNLVAEVIQSEPITAMKEAWDVNVVPNDQTGSGLEEESTSDDAQQGMGGAQ